MPYKPAEPGTAAMPAPPADPFDFWLSRDLHRLYSAVAAEPIPPELLQMLDGPTEAVEARAIGPPVREWEAGAPGKLQRFEQRVRERAYFLWLDERRPEGRAAEHWRRASALQTAHEAGW